MMAPIDELASMSRDVAMALLASTDPADFHPERDWHDLGLLVDALEARGLFLLLNSASQGGRVRRMASLHLETPQGFPCAGTSEWGSFRTIGEAVLRAAHRAVVSRNV